ncbi:MAG: hypothetical protein HYV36_04535, partial [Lentisphaerae bacterium]|nr:hypothetical protein [Lentisphaerota bacterium]
MRRTVLRAGVLSALCLSAVEYAWPTPQPPGDADTNSIVVTSTRLSFEQQQHQAVFEDNVVLTERETRILTYRLKVFFREDNKLDRLEAEGGVVITRNDLKATSQKASYDLKEGRLQLTGYPQVERDQDTLTG